MMFKTMAEAYVVIGSLVAPILLTADLGYWVAGTIGLASVAVTSYAFSVNRNAAL